MNCDISKAEKLAAARKKLKEFQNQQKSKENVTSTPLLPAEYFKPDVNLGIPLFSQTPEPAYTDQIYGSEGPVIRSDEHLPQLSHYFSDANKNNFLFDGVSRSDPTAFIKSNDSEDFLVNPSIPSSVTSSIAAEISSSPVFVSSSPTGSPPTDEVEKLSNPKPDITVEILKEELVQAETKIRMQAEALDIITTEREDLQQKFQSVLKEIESFKENVSVLQNELRESLAQNEELNRFIFELKSRNEATSKNTRTLEQNINDLKEKNEELEHALKLQVERNMIVQKQLDETQSHHDMLVLKFQQLGIETTRDNTDFKTMCEESNTIKRRYAELEEKCKTLAFEKEHTDSEYRQYIQNLQAELHQAKEELQKLSIDNQELVDKISSQTEHMSGLEKMLQKLSIKENDDQVVIDLRNEIRELKEKIETEKERYETVMSQISDYEEWKHKAISLAENLEAVKLEILSTSELLREVESNKVAASQAIVQNNKLKLELERLNNLIDTLGEDKQMLQMNLEEAEKEKEMLRLNLKEMEAENCRLTVSQNQLKTEDLNAVGRTKNDAAINTDARDESDENGCGKTNIVAMQLLQDKFKSVLDKMADLTDEKQQLEHLVMQLQSETETIEEYVALYQKQRSILQQRARETDLKMERVAIEKQRLLTIIYSILTANISDSNALKNLIQQNLSTELIEELNLCSSPVSNGAMTANPVFSNEGIGHHPSCPCCSGKLITV